MNAAFDTKRVTLIFSVAELVYLRALAAKQNDSLANSIRLALGLEPLLIGRPTAHDRQIREDQAVVLLRKAGLSQEQIPAYFSDDLPAGRPKPKMETSGDQSPIAAEGPLSTTQLLEVGRILQDYTAACTAAGAAGQPRPAAPPELDRYIKKTDVI